MKAYLSRVHFPVTTLGPGNRVGIWLQGCSIRCPGCISADTWAYGAGEIEVATLVDDLTPWLSACDGVTISGGEPFDQLEALGRLLAEIKDNFDKSVLVYSGYALEKLEPFLETLPGLIDAVISDPFEENAPRTLALRGSDNQRLTPLTPRGHALFASFERPASFEDHRFDVMFDADSVTWMAGIPKGDDFIRMESIMAEAGHRTLTSRSKGGHQ